MINKEIKSPNTFESVADLYTVYIDYPPEYDNYNRQKILTDVDAALGMIFRSFYGDHRLLPQLDGAFIDVVRYKHVLNSESTIMSINQRVNEALGVVLEGMDPTINISYDSATQKMQYHITLQGDLEVLVDNAQDNLNATIDINKKKFYE